MTNEAPGTPTHAQSGFTAHFPGRAAIAGRHSLAPTPVPAPALLPGGSQELCALRSPMVTFGKDLSDGLSQPFRCPALGHWVQGTSVTPSGLEHGCRAPQPVVLPLLLCGFQSHLYPRLLLLYFPIPVVFMYALPPCFDPEMFCCVLRDYNTIKYSVRHGWVPKSEPEEERQIQWDEGARRKASHRDLSTRSCSLSAAGLQVRT